jgi:25S rRNA (uracil2634-N3)-methyltransferase
LRRKKERDFQNTKKPHDIMVKSKRRKTQERREHNEKSNGGRPKFNVRDGPSRPKHHQSRPTKPTPEKKPTKKQQPQQQQQQRSSEPIIPFDPLDRILTIGDGDLSFSRSLVEAHGCAALLATTFDSATEVLEKYPQAQENKDAIEAEEQRVSHDVDATKLGQKEVKKQAGGWERVMFNFPHVGGKSTDVNRQVRYNQGMFLSIVLPLVDKDG